MSVVRDYWNKVSNIGLTESVEDRLARKVKLTNQIAFVAFFMTLVQMAGFHEIPGYATLCLVSIGLYAATWGFNLMGFYGLSRLYFCIISCIAVVVSGSLVSVNTNMAFKFMIIQAFIIPLVVFDLNEKKYIWTGFSFFLVSFASFDSINSIIPMMEGVDPKMFDSAQSVMANGILCLVTLYLGYGYLQKLNYKAEKNLARSLQVSNEQREIIQSKNKDIQDSINYAERIQQAILPDTDDIKINLPDHFVYYQPKEKIGGDFYWYGETGNHIIIASVDCTGHGTPGALISIIGSKLLDRIVKEHGNTNPAEILELMNLDIISTLHNEWSVASDGMDMSLVSIDTWQRKVTFAGAKNSLIISRNGKLRRIKGDRGSIGDVHLLEDGFTNHEVKLEPEDCVYMFTDGIIDQFGGPQNKKLMNRRLYSILDANKDYSMKLQSECLSSELEGWKGNNEQVDDILVIGFRVDFEHINIMKRFRNNKHLDNMDLWPKAS